MKTVQCNASTQQVESFPLDALLFNLKNSLFYCGRIIIKTIKGKCVACCLLLVASDIVDCTDDPWLYESAFIVWREGVAHSSSTVEKEKKKKKKKTFTRRSSPPYAMAVMVRWWSRKLPRPARLLLCIIIRTTVILLFILNNVLMVAAYWCIYT